jgi:hypothetical protein
MILDVQAEFSDSQVVTTSAVSTNIYDTAPNGKSLVRDFGAGDSVYLGLQVDAAATAAGAATVTITLESADNAALTSPTVHGTFGPFSIAQMTAGAQLAMAGLPYGDFKRYIGLRYTVGTGPLTGGSFSAFITVNPQVYRGYARNYVV